MATDLMICGHCEYHYKRSNKKGIFHYCEIPVIGYSIEIGYVEDNKAWVWGTPKECPYELEHLVSDEGVIKESSDGEEPTERIYRSE